MPTSNRVKKMVRARMAETGEKYTQARRAILSKLPPGCSCGSPLEDENGKTVHYEECDVIQANLGR